MNVKAISVCLMLCPLFLAGCVSVLGPADGEVDCASVACCVGADGLARPVRNPGRGEIEFSEIMADPSKYADAEDEWVELRVNSTVGGTVDLNNVVVGRVDNPDLRTVLGATSVGDEPEAMSACLEFAGGDYVVLAGSKDWVTPGLQQDIHATINFSLHNAVDQATLFLRSEETGLNIETTYVVSPGAAWALDESTGDDWCLSRDPYTSGEIPGEADLGTPGAANSACEQTCDDGNDPARPVQRPTVGQLVISEVAAAPEHDAAEWFEVYNQGEESVDLNYLRVRLNDHEPGEVVMSTACLSIAPGDYAVLATAPVVVDAAPDYMIDAGASLRNGDGKVEILGRTTDSDDEQQSLSLVTWTRAPAGWSMSLDPAAYGCGEDCQEADTDDSAWCTSEGTPGAENVSCPD